MNEKNNYIYDLIWINYKNTVSSASFSKQINDLILYTENFFDKFFYSYFLTNMYYSFNDVERIEEILLWLLQWEKIYIYVYVLGDNDCVIDKSFIPVNSVDTLFEIANEFDSVYQDINCSCDLRIKAFLPKL